MSSATSTVNPIVERILSSAAPRPAKLAAARGALPLTPAELLTLQVRLRDDPDEEIAGAARVSLSELSASIADTLAVDEETPAELLSFLASEVNRWPQAGQALAMRAGVAAETLLLLASSSEPLSLAALALNQVALAGDARLGRALSVNPALPETSRTRLLDTLDELAKISARSADTTRRDTEESTLPLAKNPFLAALGIDAEVEALLPMLDLDIGELVDSSELVGGLEESDDESTFSKLSRMNVGQKLRVALFGTATERAILVRDSNRMIAAAVVKNPKFTEQEAEAVSKSRNVNEVVLRLIARHKDFGTSYSIQHNMVVNPRCPIDLSMTYLNRLNDRDLGLLLKNRNVSEAVRRHAKKLVDAREERRRVRSPGKKH